MSGVLYSMCVYGLGDEIQEARWGGESHTHPPPQTHTHTHRTKQPLAEASSLSSPPQSSLGVPWGAQNLLLMRLEGDLEALVLFNPV
jgi:hypothetical protein